MEPRVLSWWSLISVGVALCLFPLVTGGLKPEDSGFVFILLGCMLMICAALLKARDELNMVESRLFREIREFEEAIIKLEKIERKQLEGISNWRLRDVDYRLRELEKKGGPDPL